MCLSRQRIKSSILEEDTKRNMKFFVYEFTTRVFHM